MSGSFQGSGRLFGSGNGVVKSPGYNSPDGYRKKGARNRRSAHREQAKRLAMRKLREAEEAAEYEYED